MSEKEEIAANENEDRLSSLPDAILITILSLLKEYELPKETVRTSVLSKRWRNLWSFVPHLDFSSIGNRESFVNFVTSFLRFRDDTANVNTFNLSQPISPYSRRWIHYALMHNVKKMKLFLNWSDLEEYNDLDCVFFSESLEILDFHVPIMFPVENVFLPKLQKVRFANLFLKEEFIKKILSGCPVLEWVEFSSCSLEMNQNYISCQTVKHLSMCHCSFGKKSDTTVFRIFAPNLEYLQFWGNSGKAFKFKDTTKIKKADFSEREISKCEYLSTFSSLEYLKLKNMCDLKESLQIQLRNCPTFHNLRDLYLGTYCMHCMFSILAAFLKCCPNLARLTLSHYRCYKELEGDDNLVVESFGCDSLRSILVEHYNCDTLSVDLVQGFLKRATLGVQNLQIVHR